METAILIIIALGALSVIFYLTKKKADKKCSGNCHGCSACDIKNDGENRDS